MTPGPAGEPPVQVSVVVRRGGHASLERALDSLAQQDVAVEVIVVDSTQAVRPDLRCGAHRVRRVTSPDPLSRAAAGNAGLDAATAPWLAFLDPDTVFVPGHLRALLDSVNAEPAADVAYAVARCFHPNGAYAPVGSPFNPLQLFARPIVHLPAALVSRRLVEAGCRFDEALEAFEDWDFLIQLAQLGAFRLVPSIGVEWRLEDASPAMRASRDAAATTTWRDRVHAKWAAANDALIEQVTQLLQPASELAGRGDLANAEAMCARALSISVNDPWALNLLARVRRAAGRHREALQAQQVAVAVRPEDPALASNLAQLELDAGDLAGARRWCAHALALSPGYAPALKVDALLRARSEAANEPAGESASTATEGSAGAALEVPASRRAGHPESAPGSGS